jgi:hypothetical protein
MKTVFLGSLLSLSSLISAGVFRNPYYPLVKEQASSVVKALSSQEIEGLLPYLCSQSPESAPDERLEAVVSKISLSFWDDFAFLFQQNCDEYEKGGTKLTNEEENLNGAIAMGYVMVALYRLVYEEASKRSLSIITKINNPTTLERAFQDGLDELAADR